MKMHPRLAALKAHGQSVWLDYIDRELLDEGRLARLIEDGVTGVTTNPSIFHKAITGSDRYDESIRSWLQQHPDGDAQALLEYLMIEDVGAAADRLRDVFETSGGHDGYVSIEVSPMLAHDSVATIESARRLFDALARPNVMIKIPGTKEGLAAIETSLADGINVNVTLLFAVPRHAQVLAAWASAMGRHNSPGSIACVTSFFISRIDSVVDPALEKLGSPEALALRGRIAIACARCAYAQLVDFIGRPDFAALARRGARVPRLLWGSTGTKNPAYSDVVYVEHLIGADTVNTLPPDTLAAFLDHGEVTDSLMDGLEQARMDLALLERLGISLEDVVAQLEREGVAAFASAHDQLLTALQTRIEDQRVR